MRVIAWYGKTALLLVMPLATTACADPLFGPRDELAAATRAIDRWVAQHPDEWRVTLVGKAPLTRPEWSVPCDQDPHSGMTVLQYRAGGAELQLGFRCPVAEAGGAEDLAAAFAYAALDALPHGIESSGWEFRVQTPSSSVQEGVTFRAVEAGRLLVTIETPLYAVYGHSTRPACQPPADAPSPQGCYLSVEHRIPLKLVLSVPFTGSELE